jgi:hypothetical protein
MTNRPKGRILVVDDRNNLEFPPNLRIVKCVPG